MARKRVQDAETAIMQELKDMTTAESAGATNRKPETTFEEMLNAIGVNLSDFASSENEKDGEDEEDDEEVTELCRLSDDDEPGWVMGTIPKTVQHRMESFRQKQLRLDKLTELGWGDAVNYFPSERYEVWDSRIEGSSGCQAPTTHDCSHNTPNNNWRAYAESG